MSFNIIFFVNSILIGVGLAMDAFCVSLANGLNEHNLKTGRMLKMAGVFAGFQGLMPMIGWFCVHTIAERFHAFEKFIPWIALALLLFIGGKMLMEGIHDKSSENDMSGNGANGKNVTIAALAVQGIATSIDALSVGFTIANYSGWMAFIEAIIITVITYIICLGGLRLGMKFGAKLAGKASILGGVILIGIGIEIWITGVLL